MSKNDDARPVLTLVTPPTAETPINNPAETAPHPEQIPEILKTPETLSDPISPDNHTGAGPDQPQASCVSDAIGDRQQAPIRNIPAPMTLEEFREEPGVKDLPPSVQKLLLAAPIRPVDLLERYVELHEIGAWLARYQPFIDDRMVFAAGWLSDLFAMELALRPAQSRDELRTRIMILADSWADRPENGHYERLCETALRADIARLGLPADDPVVTHFESRMVLKKDRKA